MEFIQLTFYNDKKPVFINPETIGHMYEVTEKMLHGRIDKGAHTMVGTTCHNNGGFKVTETTDQILKLIKK